MTNPWGPLPWGQAPAPDPRPSGGPPRPPEVPKALSASQVELFATCQRKWGFQYLEGVREKASATDLGTRVHTILEDYLTHGTHPDLGERLTLPHPRKVNADGSPELVTYWPGQIAQSGFYLLPPPGLVQVEGDFSTTGPLGVKWRGRKDGVYLTRLDGTPSPVVDFVPDGFVPVVLDHKTTSGPRNRQGVAPWAKTPETLGTDIQANLYAWSELERWRVDRVVARWVYYLTSGAKRDAWAVEREFTRQEVAETMATVDGLGREALRLYSLHPRNTPGVAITLDPNPQACEKYGGCPHRETCNLSPQERIRGLMTSESMDALLARKQAERATLAAGTGAPPLPASAPTQAPPIDAVTAQSLRQAVDGGASDADIARYYPGHMWYVDQLRAAKAEAARAVQAPAWAPAPQAPPVPAAPPAPPSPPAYWKPGDPMNPAQEYLRGTGKPWAVVASAADVPPPPEVAATYSVAYAQDGTRVGAPVEAGTINPPEAPPVAPPSPEFMPPAPPSAAAPAAPPDDLDAMDRERLKGLAVSMGVVDASSRLREDGLRKVIRDARAAGRMPPAPAAPPAPAPAQAAPAPSLTAAVQAFTNALASVSPAVPAAPPAPEAPEGLTRWQGVLLVNCIRLDGMAETLESILADVLPRMRADTGIPDYRLEDYGKGAGRLVSYLTAYLENPPRSIGAIMVDSRTPEGSACLTTLQGFATTVIRGF